MPETQLSTGADGRQSVVVLGVSQFVCPHSTRNITYRISKSRKQLYDADNPATTTVCRMTYEILSSERNFKPNFPTAPVDTEYFFYLRTEHGSFIVQKACICRDIP